MTRDEAIEAAYEAINGGPLGVKAYRGDIGAILDAALPVLLNDLADRIEFVGAGDENVAWSKGMLSAVRLVRAAAEGWGA